MSNFIDLHCHSTYSIQDGFGTPEMIAKRAVKLGWNAAAITEHGWLGSAPAFYKACAAEGIKPIIGCEFYVTPDHAERTKEFSDASFHLTVLALSKEGYQNLVVWNTFAHQRENYYRKPRIAIAEMVEVAPYDLKHNVILSGCLGSEICQMMLAENGRGLSLGQLYVEALKSVFPNFYIEIQNHAIPKFIDSGFTMYEQVLEDERRVREKLIELSRVSGVPLVITNDSHLQSPKQRKAHIAMKASSWRNRDDTHLGRSTEQLISTYLPDYAYFGSYMRDMEEVADGIPRQALESVAEIVKESNIKLDPLDNFSYSIPFSGYKKPVDRIRNRARKRLEKAIAKHGQAALDRFEMELEAMGEFAHYLLLMSDFIIAARRQGILTWTRGSAACSFLCYCLKIHDIDSIRFKLTFSRFFNPARKKLPDVDIDIDPARMDDFMRLVQEKMEPLIGEGQVIRICNLGTAQNRAAFRMAASALGIPKEEQDEITKLLPQMTDSDMAEDADVFEGLKTKYPQLYDLTSAIFDSIKNVSQHASAWVFGTRDRKVEDWIPLTLIASSNTMVTQFDMKYIEEFGFVKGDFLYLKSLTVISNALRAIGKSPLDFHKIPLDDPATMEMIREGHVEGVHTLQGKSTRKGMQEMEVNSIEEIIIGAALYRPANTRVDKDKLYNARRTGAEIVDYPSPLVEQIVGDTFGVPVFQEQAMEIGYAVGMDDAGVDDIYQAIKKAKGAGRGAKAAFAEVKPTFMKPARKVMNKTEAQATWEFVQDFQGYGLNKGHATSLGIIGDRMAYLKCHHPTEYYAALLDVFDDRPTYLAAARSEGYKFLLPDVNFSSGGFSTAKDQESAIRVGLGNIAKIGPGAVKEILAHQPFTDYDDFLGRTKRAAVKSNMIENLARIGALESLGVKGERSDEVEFEILGFTVNRPHAFQDCKPKHTRARTSESGWRHLGRYKGVDSTEIRCSVSKMFWLPPGAKLELKASPWANVKTWLYTCLDESGVPFHLMVNEDKEYEVKLLKFLERKCQGAVICADGMVRLPFGQGGPQGFRMFGITGAGWNDDPQIWHVVEKYRMAINELAKMKRYNNRRAG